MKGWLKTRPPGEHAVISGLFESSFDDLLQFAKSRLHLVLAVPDTFVVRQACDILQALIPLRGNCQREPVASEKHYGRLYVFAVVWSVAALLDADERTKFDEYIRSRDKVRLDLPPTDNKFTIFDYRVDDHGSDFEHFHRFFPTVSCCGSFVE